jgi:DNA-binding LacI/PurR family transcriptional regulator
MVKVADIANKTGLGYSTVAQIISGKKNYRPETIEKVMRTAGAMGYVPNYLSKALAGDKSMSIGIYMASLDSPVEVAVLHPIELAAREKHYSTFVCSSNSNDERTVTLIKGLLGRKVDGIIFYNTTNLPPKIKELLFNSGIPIVYIDIPPEKDINSLITIDNTTAFDKMAEYLAKRGHSEAYFLSNPFKINNPVKLIEPLQRALNKFDIELKVKQSWKCGAGGRYEQLAYDVVKENIIQGDIPKLLIAHNDYAAIGAIAAFEDHGLKVPKDVSIVGFEGARISPFLRPQLSTVSFPSRKLVGEKAFDMLFEMMQSPCTPERIILESKFIPGETVAQIT